MSEPRKQRAIERLSTHVLDTALGRPAAGITVRLLALEDADRTGGAGVTDADGRVGALNDRPLSPGSFQLVFDTAAYLLDRHGSVFYPHVTVEIALDGARTHYHVPVLLSAFSYSTYLGS